MIERRDEPTRPEVRLNIKPLLPPKNLREQIDRADAEEAARGQISDEARTAAKARVDQLISETPNEKRQEILREMRRRIDARQIRVESPDPFTQMMEITRSLAAAIGMTPEQLEAGANALPERAPVAVRKAKPGVLVLSYRCGRCETDLDVRMKLRDPEGFTFDNVPECPRCDRQMATNGRRIMRAVEAKTEPGRRRKIQFSE